MVRSRLFAKPLQASEQDALIHRAHQEIRARSNPLKVILFGSAGRGEMTDASDLDFVVVVRTPQEVKQTQRDLNQLSRILDWPVDCLVVSEVECSAKSQIGGVYFIAADEGILL